MKKSSKSGTGNKTKTTAKATKSKKLAKTKRPAKGAKSTRATNVAKAPHGRKETIEELKRRARELAGGEMESYSDGSSEEMEEGFWKHVVEYEEAPWTTHFQQLESAGVPLPSPDSLNDEQTTATLWEVVQKLALLNVFIEQTDHLSDRELYAHLWNHSLREDTKSFPMAANSFYHIQLLGSGSDEDNHLYLKYYADKNFRRHWHNDFPSDPMPDHEDPPYDRDRLLPKPDYNAFYSGDPN